MKLETKIFNTMCDGTEAFIQITRYSDGYYTCDSHHYPDYQDTGLCDYITQEEMAEFWGNKVSDSQSHTKNIIRKFRVKAEAKYYDIRDSFCKIRENIRIAVSNVFQYRAWKGLYLAVQGGTKRHFWSAKKAVKHINDAGSGYAFNILTYKDLISWY